MRKFRKVKLKKLLETITKKRDADVYDEDIFGAKVHFEQHSCMPCHPFNFTVNGIKPEFGEADEFIESHSDADSEYCSMEYEVVKPTPEVLQKFKINEKQFNAISKRLAEIFTSYDCGACL